MNNHIHIADILEEVIGNETRSKQILTRSLWLNQAGQGYHGSRFYHTTQHVVDFYLAAEHYRNLISQWEEFAAAIVFHDFVYDVRSLTNEADSAEFALRALRSIGWSDASSQRVHDLIIDSVDDFDGDLFHDLDFSILGANSKRYIDYVSKIKYEFTNEQNGFTEDEYYRGRFDFVCRQLVQKNIYRTGLARSMWEEQAFDNLRNEYEDLKELLENT